MNFIIPIVVYVMAVRRAGTEAAQAADADARKSADEGSAAQPARAEDIPSPTKPAEADGAAAKAELSISSTVAWLKALGSGKRPKGDAALGGLRPSPIQHYSFSIASTATEDRANHSPVTPVQPLTSPSSTPSISAASPTSASFTALSSSSLAPSGDVAGPQGEEEKLSSTPKLQGQALRWAAEEDREREAGAAAAAGSLSPRDPTQPAAGSLRLSHPATPVSSTPSSRHNLLAGLTSSFTARSPHPSSEAHALEMTTPTSSAARTRQRKGHDEDDYDADAIQVEEEGMEEEEDEEAKSGGVAGSARSLPAINEAQAETSRSAADHDGAAMTLVDAGAEAEPVWHVVKAEWLQYRVPTAFALLSVMVLLCLLALEEQIRQQA